MEKNMLLLFLAEKKQKNKLGMTRSNESFTTGLEISLLQRVNRISFDFKLALNVKTCKKKI